MSVIAECLAQKGKYRNKDLLYSPLSQLRNKFVVKLFLDNWFSSELVLIYSNAIKVLKHLFKYNYNSTNELTGSNIIGHFNISPIWASGNWIFKLFCVYPT